MISALIQLALASEWWSSGGAGVAVRWSVCRSLELDIEAYPDPVQPMVEVLTLPNGLSAEEVERLVTVPLEFGLGGMLNLQAMRSISLFGLSDIRCYFDWDSDYYLRPHADYQPARIRLAAARHYAPGISPENPIGEIYRYTVESPDHDLIKEKEIEDWVLEKQLKTVPGVIDVSGFGGLTKQYHVDVDPQRLTYYHIPLATLFSTMRQLQHQRGRQLS